MVKMQRVLGIIGLICGLAIPGWSLEANSAIRGQVNFTGTIPQREPMKIAGDRVCEEIHAKKPILRDDVIVNPNRTLKNVVVWIESGGPDSLKRRDANPPKASLVQQGCSFYPRVLAVQTGQQLELRNSDPTLHNINAIPKENKRFNKAMIGEKAKPEIVTFDKPEVAVRLRCDIHPWMVAWVAVFDHSLFDISSEDGTFEITGIPPGEYVVNTWHETLGTASAEILVKDSTPAEAIFTYTNTGSASGTQRETVFEAIPTTKTTTGTSPTAPAP